MGKTSSAVKNRYNAKAYDQVLVMLPKGRKEAVQQFAKDNGVSVNGLINDLLATAMGIDAAEWKDAPVSHSDTL